MKKKISRTCLILFSLALIITSCDTLRKTPGASASERSTSSRSSGSRGSGRPTLTNRRPPARKPAPRPSARKAPAGTPSSTYANRALSPSEIPQVVQVARTYTGTPYRSGGNDKNGIDCSGLICSVYSEVGMKVPRISWQQSEFGQEIAQIKDVRAGDWLFFVPEAGKEGYVSHAGIVTDVRGPEEIIFIHASTSRGVREDNLFSNYFKGRFVKAMRPF